MADSQAAPVTKNKTCTHAYKLLSSETTIVEFKCAICKGTDALIYKCGACGQKVCSSCKAKNEKKVKKAEREAQGVA